MIFPRRFSGCVLVGFASFIFSFQTQTLPVCAQTQITIDPEQRRNIGGVSTLDRAKFFTYTETIVPPSSSNLGNLRLETYSESGLNLVTGRISTEFDQFISSGGNIPQDAARPGTSFMDPAALRSRLQGDYRNFVTSSSRWEPIRNTTNNPIVVNSGRAATFFPEYFRQGEQSSLFPDRDAYAEFFNIYLDEAVYGSNAFLPVDQDRFHIEIINEPDLHIAGAFGGTEATLLASSTEMAEYHRDIADAVKAVHPQASIGGPSLALASFPEDDFRRWNNTVKPFIEVAGGSVDFYSIHPYERYDVQSDGSVDRRVDQSPGRINAQLDMLINQHEQTHGDRLPISLTEYASFNRSNNGDYGNYARDEQQWDLSRDFREQLLVYLDRPDAILNATPFVAPKHFSGTTPTPENADNVLFEQDASGQYSETIVGNTFRIYSKISGDYIAVDGGTGDLQTAGFRDGDTVYLALNNLLDSNQDVDLDVLVSGLGAVDSASISRVYRDGGQNFFIEDVDVTSSFSSLTLNPQEGAVLTFNLSGTDGILVDANEQTYYGDQVVTGLNVPVGQSPVIEIDADLLGAVSAKLRVGYSRAGNSPEPFVVLVNGNLLTINGDDLGIDDEDFDLFSREVDVPVAFLTNGVNEVQVDFSGNGGFLSTAALTVTSIVEPGDFDGDGDVDADDIDAFTGNIGLDPIGELAALDLDSDGEITEADRDFHISSLVQTSLGRGTLKGDLDLTGTVDVFGDGFSFLSNIGLAGGWARGDFTGDGQIDVFGDGFLLLGNLGSTAPSAASVSSTAAVPEPGCLALLLGGALTMAARRRKR